MNPLNIFHRAWNAVGWTTENNNRERHRQIMKTQAEVAEQLRKNNAAIVQIGKETEQSLELIKKLQEAVENQTNASEELIAAADALEANIKSVNDKVPDATETETQG